LLLGFACFSRLEEFVAVVIVAQPAGTAPSLFARSCRQKPLDTIVHDIVGLPKIAAD
jgi:hypothetical protein